MWEKIVLNLVSNAFKFTLEGEIEVALEQCRQRARGWSSATPGRASPRSSSRIFLSGSTASRAARARTHEGTGIGLALVQELVRLHGGIVQVESVVGQGTTFQRDDSLRPVAPARRPHRQFPARRPRPLVGAKAYLVESLRWLPESGNEDSPLIEALDRLPAPDRDDGDRRRPRILLADDNADMREYVRRLLAGRYDVRTVADGEAALAAARAERPDLVLTDVMMPRLDGFGLLRELRRRPSDGNDSGHHALGTRRRRGPRRGHPVRGRRLPGQAVRRSRAPGPRQSTHRARPGEAGRRRGGRAGGGRSGKHHGRVFALDSDWRFTYMNAEAERINGVSRGELLGKATGSLSHDRGRHR